MDTSSTLTGCRGKGTNSEAPDGVPLAPFEEDHFHPRFEPARVREAR